MSLSSHLVIRIATEQVYVGLKVVRLVLVGHHEQNHELLVDVLQGAQKTRTFWLGMGYGVYRMMIAGFVCASGSAAGRDGIR